ncbi:YdeI/OmpD-associated family protein [Fictibacillus sp. NRS-1165]|uniref:YdeI/OmpD-associated family protein n=1 Tax=Fictibacillus sp. NRS-1165 TaxID=3144463 RepID=UPI003D1BD541
MEAVRWQKKSCRPCGLKISKHWNPSYAEALESGLCYGWIDSQKEKYDDQTWLQRIYPERAEKHMAKGKEKAEELIKAGRMKPAGLRMAFIKNERGK